MKNEGVKMEILDSSYPLVVEVVTTIDPEVAFKVNHERKRKKRKDKWSSSLNIQSSSVGKRIFKKFNTPLNY